MKYLYIIRHAKSDWSDDSLPDIERPLNARGLRDAPVMAKRFFSLAGRPDLLITSPAVRAATTCRFFAEATGIPQSEIITEKEFYFGNGEMILRILDAYLAAKDKVVIFGHNPTFSELAAGLAPAMHAELPTCGMVSIGFPKGFRVGAGKLLWFEYPKNQK